MIFRLRSIYKHTFYAVITFIVICFLTAAFFKLILHATCPCRDSEPIDVVYTWVNGSDPLFLGHLENHSDPILRPLLDKFKTRYFDRQELRFSLRSLEKYAPWIRNVYIVTNGQIPYWLNLDHEKVFLVQHEEIFTNISDLPTFSSPAIETHIHKIPGLSKRFLYFNDDIYLGAPIYLTDFYVKGHGFLIYLDYPMQSCAKDCSWIYVHDGQCDKSCNVPSCQMDGGDCENSDEDQFQHEENQLTEDTTTNIPKTLYNTYEFDYNITESPQIHFKTAFHNLPPNLEKSSVKRLVDTHNRDKIRLDKLRRRKKVKHPSELVLKYFDAYRESLQHTNRLFNTKYGFKHRFVPAHMPFLIDRDIMRELQESFPGEYAKTSSNRLRAKDDLQFAFSYFHFLIEEKVYNSIEEIFDIFDTDLSGTWSDREIRTILTRLTDIPLSSLSIDEFDSLLINCSKIVQPKDVPTPEYERYIDSILPTISKELVTHCEDLKTLLLDRFSKKSKYLYEIIKNVSKYVTFEMIESDIQSTVIKLDKTRKNPTKFVCLNDNVYLSHNESTINAIWYDFYLSLFPNPSRFELPSEYRNRFMYIGDLKTYQMKMTLYLYCCVFTSVSLILWFLYKHKFFYLLKNKVFC